MIADEELAVIIPTIDGRERELARTLSAYRMTVPLAKVIICRGFPACGPAWNWGAERALGQHRGLRLLHFGADDLVPQPGWTAEAFDLAAVGVFPGARLLNDDGSVWNHFEPAGSYARFPRVPLLTVEAWAELGPVPPVHYWTDLYLARKGARTLVVESYRFVHLLSPTGRIEARMDSDYQAVERAIASEAL